MRVVGHPQIHKYVISCCQICWQAIESVLFRDRVITIYGPQLEVSLDKLPRRNVESSLRKVSAPSLCPRCNYKFTGRTRHHRLGITGDHQRRKRHYMCFTVFSRGLRYWHSSHSSAFPPRLARGQQYIQHDFDPHPTAKMTVISDMMFQRQQKHTSMFSFISVERAITSLPMFKFPSYVCSSRISEADIDHFEIP